MDGKDKVDRRDILNINRRKVIQTTGIAVGATSISGVTQAKESDEYHIGKRGFIEVYIEHDGANITDGHRDSIVPGYVLDITRNILTVSGDASSFRENQYILSHQRSFHPPHEIVGGEEDSRFKVQKSYADRRNPAWIHSQEEHSKPKLSLTDTNTEAIKLDVDGEIIQINEGDKIRRSLAPISIQHEQTEKAYELIPNVHARYNRVDVYSLNSVGLLFPKQSSDNWIKGKVEMYRKARERGHNPPPVEENDDFLVVKARS